MALPSCYAFFPCPEFPVPSSHFPVLTSQFPFRRGAKKSKDIPENCFEIWAVFGAVLGGQLSSCIFLLFFLLGFPPPSVFWEEFFFWHPKPHALFFIPRLTLHVVPKIKMREKGDPKRADKKKNQKKEEKNWHRNWFLCLYHVPLIGVVVFVYCSYQHSIPFCRFLPVSRFPIPLFLSPLLTLLRACVHLVPSRRFLFVCLSILVVALFAFPPAQPPPRATVSRHVVLTLLSRLTPCFPVCVCVLRRRIPFAHRNTILSENWEVY